MRLLISPHLDTEITIYIRDRFQFTFMMFLTDLEM